MEGNQLRNLLASEITKKNFSFLIVFLFSYFQIKKLASNLRLFDFVAEES